MNGTGDGQVDFSPRRVRWGEKQVLEIRSVVSTDVDGLGALYDGLDAEDRQRRFFAFHRPSPEFLEGMADAADRGGFGLVAVADPDAAARIVGEAGYVLLPNGDGELGITVVKGWRGWLGPYLLDALVEAARARGVPNIEADVLIANKPMLALLRARGSAVMAYRDWTITRVAIGTAGPTPTWPDGHDRPRVLVEGWWPAQSDARALRLQLMSCAGPEGRRYPCPLLAGHACPLAADADVIVVGPPAPDAEPWGALLEAHERTHGGVPVCVALPEGSVRMPDLSEAVAGPATGVIALVQGLAKRHFDSGGAATVG